MSDDGKVAVARFTLWQGGIAALIAGLCGVVGSYLQFVAKQPATVGEIDARLDRRLPGEVAATFDRRLPIGTIVASVVEPAIFSELAGDPGGFEPTRSVWVPADGRDVSGSAYAAQHPGTTRVPDLRGLFLRGLNRFQPLDPLREDGLLDPEDGLLDETAEKRHPYAYQWDALQQHEHETTATTFDWARTGKAGYTGRAQNAPTAKVTAVMGARMSPLETRPKNAAVYYYIKIN